MCVQEAGRRHLEGSNAGFGMSEDILGRRGADRIEDS